MNSEIDFKTGDESILDEIKELWEELNYLHFEKSLHFKQHYIAFTFQSRKETLINTAASGKLFIAIAYDKDIKIGYCVSSVVNKIGEIDSIFIKPNYRKEHVGNALMEASINWIKASNVKKIIVKVSVGNEEVYGFYSKYGFKPRLTELQILEENP